MHKTRLSLYYLAGYLLGGGVCFLFLPQLSAALFQTNAVYPDVMLRTVGMFMISLAIIVFQIIRYRAEALYATTLIVRTFLCVSLMAFFVMVRDPMFLVLLAIVISGMLITGPLYLSEKNKTK